MNHTPIASLGKKVLFCHYESSFYQISQHLHTKISFITRRPISEQSASFDGTMKLSSEYCNPANAGEYCNSANAGGYFYNLQRLKFFEILESSPIQFALYKETYLPVFVMDYQSTKKKYTHQIHRSLRYRFHWQTHEKLIQLILA